VGSQQRSLSFFSEHAEAVQQRHPCFRVFGEIVEAGFNGYKPE
jgi:hypothetical protein